MVNTQTIGKIVEFFPDTQTATVETMGSTIVSTTESNYVDVGTETLIDVPVCFPQDQNFVTTYPVKEGDTCIVFFLQEGMSHWLYEGRENYEMIGGRPETSAMRENSKTDAYCMLGFNNQQNLLTNFNPDDMEIRSKTTNQKIILKADGTMEFVADAGININGVTIDSSGNITTAGNVDITGTTSSITTPKLLTPSAIVGGALVEGDLVGGVEQAGHVHLVATEGTNCGPAIAPPAI